MKEEINKNEIQLFNRNSKIFSLLLVLFIISFVPLFIYLKYAGLIISAFIYITAIYYGLKIEKAKKKYDIQTYKEIIAFTEGKKLDEITKAQESGKRPYQKALLPFAAGVITFLVCILLSLFLKN